MTRPCATSVLCPISLGCCWSALDDVDKSTTTPSKTSHFTTTAFTVSARTIRCKCQSRTGTTAWLLNQSQDFFVFFGGREL
uniref:Putative secreted protein n=1 Tax=Anopheles marajoara TaxID=58244 RepID=A0A2M4CBH4_9DIPT